MVLSTASKLSRLTQQGLPLRYFLRFARILMITLPVRYNTDLRLTTSTTKMIVKLEVPLGV
jgi:hypothetical protein